MSSDHAPRHRRHWGYLVTAVLAVAVAGLGLASPAGATPPPPVNPTRVVAPGPGVSPHQPSVNAQLRAARARLRVHRHQAHPGRPERLTHPGVDHAGIAPARPGAGPGRAPAASPGAASSTSVPGLDVSSHQGAVNWARVKAHGAQFADAKATEGLSYASPTFLQQYDGAYNAGLVRGAYHFAVPNNSSGAAQADYFVAYGGAWVADSHTLPGMLDIEFNPYGPECYGLSKAQMVAWISSFSAEYHLLTARWPIIYTATSWWKSCTGNYPGFAGTDPLWIANWGGTPYPLPAGWPSYLIWQYADHGVFPGDQDSFHGSHAQLVSFANTPLPAAPATGVP